jgi:hypothetical protein
MFLVPQHLRETLHSILTASPTDGPHTALLTSTQGQLYVSGSTYDPDWDESLERPDPVEDASIADADDDGDEEEEEEDVEPDLSMPEWRRTLRGMANREWKDHVEQGGKDTERLRLQCDVSPSTIPSAHRMLTDPAADRKNPLCAACCSCATDGIARRTHKTSAARRNDPAIEREYDGEDTLGAEWETGCQVVRAGCKGPSRRDSP